MINMETENAKEIAKYFSCEVNNFSFNPIKTAEELKNSKHMDDLNACWIRVLSSPDYLTDGRNEIAARKGRQLAEIPFVRRRMELVDNPKMEEVDRKMSADHRTLQQTFSKLVFYHFMQNCGSRDRQTLLRTMGEDFYRLPLI